MSFSLTQASEELEILTEVKRVKRGQIYFK
jgi:hypothetical protein